MTHAGHDANDELMQVVYDELRAIAAAHLRNERVGHTLQPTALVHEAFMRLRETDRMRWKDRTHFLMAAAVTVRRVLVDHARGRGASKREGERRRVTLTGLEERDGARPIDMLVVDDLLEQLAAFDERKCRVVELRFFGGLSIDETAAALGVGTTTVEDDWAFARTWLRRKLVEGEAGSDGT